MGCCGAAVCQLLNRGMDILRFRVQLVQDLATRLAVLWDGGIVAAESPHAALALATARVPDRVEQQRRAAAVTRWLVRPATEPTVTSAASLGRAFLAEFASRRGVASGEPAGETA